MNIHKDGISDAELVNNLNSTATNRPIIVECGSHDGRDTKRFLDLFPNCRVYCFEPDPRPIERKDPPGFLDRVGNDPRVALVQAAIGDKDKHNTILYRSSGTPPRQQIQDWDHSSSLSVPTKHLEWSPWCTFPEEKQLKVQMIKLDTWHRNWFDKETIDLIWADIQGGQRAMVAGAKKVLAKTHWLYIECHKEPMYAAEPTQPELLELLAPFGFEVHGLYEGYNFLLKNKELAYAA